VRGQFCSNQKGNTTMAKKLSPKALEKAQDKLIEQIFNAYCKGMPINIMEIPKLCRMAKAMLAQGASQDQIGSAMQAMCEPGVS
jgi:hypothetical protein